MKIEKTPELKRREKVLKAHSQFCKIAKEKGYQLEEPPEIAYTGLVRNDHEGVFVIGRQGIEKLVFFADETVLQQSEAELKILAESVVNRNSGLTYGIEYYHQSPFTKSINPAFLENRVIVDNGHTYDRWIVDFTTEH